MINNKLAHVFRRETYRPTEISIHDIILDEWLHN